MISPFLDLFAACANASAGTPIKVGGYLHNPNPQNSNGEWFGTFEGSLGYTPETIHRGEAPVGGHEVPFIWLTVPTLSGSLKVTVQNLAAADPIPATFIFQLNILEQPVFYHSRTGLEATFEMQIASSQYPEISKLSQPILMNETGETGPESPTAFVQTSQSESTAQWNTRITIDFP